MKRFWEVIYDGKAKTMEIIGTSSDDTLLTNNVAEMQLAGFDVRCNTADADVDKSQIKLPYYTIEENLYQRLLNEYQLKTGKQLKRW